MCDAGMSQPIPIGALASALANSTREQQSMMLGENLYPLVDQLEHDHAMEITGMLLEMDQTKVLHLLKSAETLRQKLQRLWKFTGTPPSSSLTPLLIRWPRCS